MIRDHLINKKYLCLVHGILTPSSGALQHYLQKNSDNNSVAVYTAPRPGTKKALMRYRTISSKGPYSLLEVELITGRTHQIRAQLAFIGHPLVGDAKYGIQKNNRETGYRFQALYAYRLSVQADTKAQHLDYLNNKVFEVNKVWFREEFEAGMVGNKKLFPD